MNGGCSRVPRLRISAGKEPCTTSPLVFRSAKMAGVPWTNGWPRFASGGAWGSLRPGRSATSTWANRGESAAIVPSNRLLLSSFTPVTHIRTYALASGGRGGNVKEGKELLFFPISWLIFIHLLTLLIHLSSPSPRETLATSFTFHRCIHPPRRSRARPGEADRPAEACQRWTASRLPRRPAVRAC